MIPLIIIRPQPGTDDSVAAAQALGMEALGFPLFSIEALPWDAPPPENYDALLVGSANVFRHGGVDLARFRGKPVYAVGDSTAAAAKAAGFAIAEQGSGGLQEVLKAIAPAHRRLLRLAAQARVPLNLPEGMMMDERILYASKPLPMQQELRLKLGQSALVLLHSAEAARHFLSLANAARIDRSRIALAAIAPRVADAAGSGWARVGVAKNPDDAALLALAQQMCQIA